MSVLSRENLVVSRLQNDRRLSPEARAAISAGMPDATRRAYLEDLDGYTYWCLGKGWAPFPCDATQLAEYATYLAYITDRPLSPGSIERARWAILKWHRLAGAAPPDTSGLVDVLKGYRDQLARSKSPMAQPRKATPAGKDSLTAIIRTLDRRTRAGQRDAAMILLGFGIAARRSELASLDICSITPAAEGIQIEVYRQKTRLMTAPVLHYQANTELCPARAVMRWIETLSAWDREDGALFIRIDRHDNLAPRIIRDGKPIGDQTGRMTAQAIGQRIRHDALAAGLAGNWTGHSLRRGYVTESHRAGVDRRIIERQGGWAAGSAVVSGYIEDADRWLIDVLEGVL